MDLVAPVIDINKFIFRLMMIDSAHFDSVLTATQAAWQALRRMKNMEREKKWGAWREHLKC